MMNDLDKIAIAAMQGLIETPRVFDEVDDIMANTSALTRFSYDIAEAMAAEHARRYPNSLPLTPPLHTSETGAFAKASEEREKEEPE